jgi:hypothetical protein
VKQTNTTLTATPNRISFYNDKPNTTNPLLYCFVMSPKAVTLQIFFFYYWMHIIIDIGVNGETIPAPT